MAFLSLSAACACWLLSNLAVAALAQGDGPRRWLAAPFIVTALCLPLLTHATPASRFALSAVGILTFMRGLELIRRQLVPAHRRLWHLLALFDTRLARRGPPVLEARAVAQALLVGTLCVPGALLAAWFANRQAGPLHWLLRWGGSALLVVAFFESATRLYVLAYRAAGIRSPALHDAPHLSKSLREFWGERWNKFAGGWLRANVFVPLLRRRRSVRLATVGTFLASALGHWYLIATSGGLAASLMMAAFFVLQIPMLALESALGVERWPRAWGRLWTWVALLVPAPLFLEPLMGLLDRSF